MEEIKIYTLDELRIKLTKKERLFCHEYIIDWNGGRAALKAGYSENSRYEIAHENLRKPHITQYIDFIKSDLEKEAGLSKLMAINELKKFAFNGFESINNTWVTRNEFEDLPSDVKACIQEIDTKVYKKDIGPEGMPDIVDVEHIKIKLMDRRGALQDLSKMLGWNEAEKKIVDQNLNIDANKISLSLNGSEIELK